MSQELENLKKERQNHTNIIKSQQVSIAGHKQMIDELVNSNIVLRTNLLLTQRVLEETNRVKAAGETMLQNLNKKLGELEAQNAELLKKVSPESQPDAA